MKTSARIFVVEKSLCQSLFVFGPFLTIGGFWSILALVVFVFNLTPVGWKHGATWSLIAFHHSSTSVLIGSLIDLLEETIECGITFRFVILAILLDFLVNLRPVAFDLRAWWVAWFGAGGSGCWNSLSLRTWGWLLKSTPVEVLGSLSKLDIDALRRACPRTCPSIDWVAQIELR